MSTTSTPDLSLAGTAQSAFGAPIDPTPVVEVVFTTGARRFRFDIAALERIETALDKPILDVVQEISQKAVRSPEGITTPEERKEWSLTPAGQAAIRDSLKSWRMADIRRMSVALMGITDQEYLEQLPIRQANVAFAALCSGLLTASAQLYGLDSDSAEDGQGKTDAQAPSPT